MQDFFVARLGDGLDRKTGIEIMKTDTTRFLLAIGGLGGLLYGIDFGIIAVSMPYIKALGIYTDAEVSWIVGAVMFGGILASASAGVSVSSFSSFR